MMEEVVLLTEEEDKEGETPTATEEEKCVVLTDSLLQDDSVVLYDETSNKSTSNSPAPGSEKNTTPESVEAPMSPTLSDGVVTPPVADSSPGTAVQHLTVKNAVNGVATEVYDNAAFLEDEHDHSRAKENLAEVDVKFEDEEESRVAYEVLEKQNLDLLCETADQKKVIEMLRIELMKKDEELVKIEIQLKNESGRYEREYKKLQDETTKKFAELKKAFDIANRDKESMVIKYAMGEKDILLARKAKELSEKKLLEVTKDKDSLQYKIKTLGTERTRLQGICDTRAQETLAAKKEGDRWKEEVRQMESKLSAANSRLKTEADTHRETRESLDRTLAQLAEVQGSVDKVKAECQEVIEKARQEEVKEKLKEKEQEVKLMIDSVAAAELENIRKKHKTLLEENNDLSIKVQTGERERLAYESTLSELKETANRQKVEIVDLYAKCAELESVKLQLDREMEKCSAKDAEVVRLRAEALELQSDMASCRKKEAELLDFTQKLTDKNVNLQSEFSSIELRAKTLEEEHSRLAVALSKCESRLSEALAKLETETSTRLEESERLTNQLAEKTAQCERDAQFASDAKNEVDVLKRQNNLRIRELTKELNAAKRRLSTLEPEGNTSLSPCSRTSSNSSLTQVQETGELPSVGGRSPGHFSTHLSPSHTTSSSNYLTVNGYDGNAKNRKISAPEPGSGGGVGGMPDTQVLVEKIVKLQRSCARRQEKLDFLEEHVEQLLAEIQKKNKIIQTYVLNLEPGALISEQSDIHKAVLGSQGGIMSSVYSSKVTDSGMTLELSLEISKKLQAVLEDTLLKNITLKENINTLGGEISKLSMKQNSH